MPDPTQDPLTLALAARAQAPQAQTKPPLAALQKPFEGGMDTLLSALGVRAQKPGDLATGLGVAIGTAGMLPKLPFGMLATEGEASLSPLLRKLFAENPAAEATYTKAMATQLPEALAARHAAGVSRYATQDKAHDALLDLLHSDRPRPIPTDTGFMTAIPRDGNLPTPSIPMVPDKPSILGGSGTNVASTRATNMAKTGLTPAIVRDIRTLDKVSAIEKYPTLSPSTIWGILRGDTYGGIK